MGDCLTVICATHNLYICLIDLEQIVYCHIILFTFPLLILETKVNANKITSKIVWLHTVLSHNYTDRQTCTDHMSEIIFAVLLISKYLD